jgi:hypothetical protein
MRSVLLLNNRELASLILLAVCFAGAMLSRSIRESLLAVLKAAFAPRLVVLWLLYIGSLSLAIWGVSEAGLRYDGSIKDAVVWGLLAGLPLFTSFNKVAKREGYWTSAFIDAFKFTALVEVFVNLYVFPLPIELLLQPVVVLMSLTSHVAGSNPETRPAKRLLDGLLSISGVVVLIIVAKHLATDGLDLSDTVLTFLQPSVLTAVILPLTYLVGVYSSYELAFVRIKIRNNHCGMACRAALISGLRFRVRLISGFAGHLPPRLAEAPTFAAKRSLVRDYREGRTSATDWAPAP